MQQLHSHRDAQHARLRGLPGGDEHQQRPQALAPGGDRRPAVARQHGAVAARQLGQAFVERLHQRRDVAAGGGDDRLDGGDGGHHGTVPWWIAMMPPAVSSQWMSRRPTSSIAAARSSGPGKRLTELGR